MRRRPSTALALLCLAALLAAATAALPSSAAPPAEPGSGSGGPAESGPGTVPPARPRGTAVPARGSPAPPPPPPEEEAVAEEEEEEQEEEEEAAAAGSGPAGERPARIHGQAVSAGPRAGSGTGLRPILCRADKGEAGDGAAVAAPRAPPAAVTPGRGGRRDPRSISRPSSGPDLLAGLCPPWDTGWRGSCAQPVPCSGWCFWGAAGLVLGQATRSILQAVVAGMHCAPSGGGEDRYFPSPFIHTVPDRVDAGLGHPLVGLCRSCCSTTNEHPRCPTSTTEQRESRVSDNLVSPEPVFLPVSGGVFAARWVLGYSHGI